MANAGKYSNHMCMLTIDRFLLDFDFAVTEHVGLALLALLVALVSFPRTGSILAIA